MHNNRCTRHTSVAVITVFHNININIFQMTWTFWTKYWNRGTTGWRDINTDQKLQTDTHTHTHTPGVWSYQTVPVADTIIFWLLSLWKVISTFPCPLYYVIWITLIYFAHTDDVLYFSDRSGNAKLSLSLSVAVSGSMSFTGMTNNYTFVLLKLLKESIANISHYT